ncbi:hypothetical protein GGF46_004622 [Coemansia sp. RSA 552]|nr:hypothetical protein GGF46_004622 [Coemansia sp. RSA 552]
MSSPLPEDSGRKSPENTGLKTPEDAGSKSPAEAPRNEAPAEDSAAAEPVVSHDVAEAQASAAGKVDMNGALAKARAIAAKLGSMQQPQAPAAAAAPPAVADGDVPDDEEYIRGRRSASPEVRRKRGRSGSRERGRESRPRRQQQQQYQGDGGSHVPRLEFPVPSSLSGLIIGRGGSNLRGIEQRHGVRVQFVDPHADRRNPQRQVMIEGPVPNAEGARQDILDFVARHNEEADGMGPSGGPGPVAGGGGRDDPGTMVTIMVPSSKVGLIIGRGGESIKDIQFSSGASVQVQPDDGSAMPERPIHLRGAPEQIDRARERIMDIDRGYGGDRRPPAGQFSGSNGMPLGRYDQAPQGHQQRGGQGGYGGGYGQQSEQYYGQGGASGQQQQQQQASSQYQGYQQPGEGGERQPTNQWTYQQTADYYAQYAATSPEYAQYAEYYRKIAEKDPNGIVPTNN